MISNPTAGDRRIVWLLQEVAPEPGCDLVIFEQVGQGKKFREVVPAGEEFRVPLAERALHRRKYLAYAVVRDPNLEHEVSIPCDSRDGLGPLAVHATIYFEVSNPRRLAEAGDPLPRLMEEVKRLARRAVSRFEWSTLVDGEVDVEQEILSAMATDESGDRLPHAEILRNLASQLGLRLKNIRLSTSLPTYETDPGREIHKIGKQERVAEAEHDRLKKEAKRQAELQAAEEENRRALDQIRAERERWQEEHQSQIEALRRGRLTVQANAERLRELAGRVVGALGIAMDGVASRMETPQELVGAIEAIRDVQRRTRLLVPGTESESQALAEASPTLLTAATGPRGRVIRKISELFEIAAHLPPDSNQPRRVTSIGLHMLAEALLGAAADPALLSRFHRDLEEEIKTLVASGRASSHEQLTVLKHFCDVEALKVDLA